MDISAAALVRRARGTTPQADMAARLGIARETIARWEAGTQEPSFGVLRAFVRAAGWELRTELVPAHESLVADVERQTDLSPTERLRAVMAEDWEPCRQALRVAGATHDHAVIVGPIAAVIRGTPVKPSTPNVDLVAPKDDLRAVDRCLRSMGAQPETATAGYRLGPGATLWAVGDSRITVRADPAGVNDVVALRDRSPCVSMTYAGVPVARVALVEDLLDLAEAATRDEDRELLHGLRAVLASGRYSARKDREV